MLTKMRFETSAYPAEIKPMLRRFIGIAGWAAWKRRFETFENWITDNPLLENFIAERYPIELAMAHLIGHSNATGRIQTKIASVNQYRLFAFVSMTARVYQRVGKDAQMRIAGILRDGLKSNKGLSPFVAEMVIAAHLMARGFDVQFHDLELGNGFDFLAAKEGLELEIECKHISGDVGRQIHKRRLYSLGGVAYEEISRALEQCAGGQFIRVTLPDRLTGQHDQLTSIQHQLSSALQQGATVIGPDSTMIEYSRFSLIGSPFDTSKPDDGFQHSVRAFLEQEFGAVNPSVLIHFRPHHGAVVLVVQSRRKDKVLKGIISQLKNSSRDQLTGTRPAIMCVFLSDMESEQLRMLAASEGTGSSGGTGIQFGITHLIDRRPHIHTVALMADGPVYRSTNELGLRRETTLQEHGGVYAFKNAAHLCAGDTRCNVF